MAMWSDSFGHPKRCFRTLSGMEYSASETSSLSRSFRCDLRSFRYAETACELSVSKSDG